MPAYHVQRSVVIRAPAEQVFDKVVDFSTWTTWSPWLCVDREAEVKVSEDPRSLNSLYSWSGELVGIGEIEHVRLDPPRLVEEELRFLKPFKSTSSVSFDLEPARDGTRLTWHMRGKLPVYMFWMKKSMETFVGMDYERGLRMLRELIETGEVLTRTDVVGVEPVETMDVFGVRETCAATDIGPSMKRAIDSATELFSRNGIPTDGEMISVYHPVDINERRFDFTIGHIVTGDVTPPAGINHCRLPAGRALHVRHTGSYDNLGNAWSGAFQFARYKKIKLASKEPSYEIYRSDPTEEAPADWVTDIFVPVKS